MRDKRYKIDNVESVDKLFITRNAEIPWEKWYKNVLSNNILFVTNKESHYNPWGRNFASQVLPEEDGAAGWNMNIE